MLGILARAEIEMEYAVVRDPAGCTSWLAGPSAAHVP
jgi:hypothetical protein